MAHNWLTLDQDISDLQAQLDFLHGACEKYMTTLKDQTEGWPADFNVDMCDSFTVLKSQCDVLKRWTQAYHDRTNIRINLVGVIHRAPFSRIHQLSLIAVPSG